MESELKVTISGAQGAGKSTLAYLLTELLSTRGVGVYGENPEDGGAHSFRVNSAESFAAYTLPGADRLRDALARLDGITEIIEQWSDAEDIRRRRRNA